jgi:hypothetical protein
MQQVPTPNKSVLWIKSLAALECFVEIFYFRQGTAGEGAKTARKSR